MANTFKKKIRGAINWNAVWTEDDAVPVVSEIFDNIVS